MDIRGSLGIKLQVVKLVSNLQLVIWLRMHGVIPPVPHLYGSILKRNEVWEPPT
jgi:hypothetical protein